ncbi:hypothetical protein OXH55_06380 [Clostridium ganghwense]|uniref:Uncharacterized protein n=2 Tax=Clostridium ganghwense TaxID=312089 RepID=A0ABT4CMJ1_9CLOT|nr:hypothetical protein [Clostridium ganghwense]
MRVSTLENNSVYNDSYNIKKIKETLNNIDPQVKAALILSLQEANENPMLEKDLINLWGRYFKTLSDFLFTESEKSGNKDIYKKIMKYIIFNR